MFFFSSFFFLRKNAFFLVVNEGERLRDTLTGGKLSVISQLSGRQFSKVYIARSVFIMVKIHWDIGAVRG